MKNKKIRGTQETYLAYKPIYQELYSAAYLITGNERISEDTILDIIIQNPYPAEDDGKRLMERVINESLKRIIRDTAEDFFFSGTMNEKYTKLTEAIIEFPDDEMRIFLLKYAIGLGARDISRASGKSNTEIKSILDRFKRTAMSFSKNEKHMIYAMRNSATALFKCVCQAPDFNALIRAAEVRMQMSDNPAKYRKKIKGVFSLIISMIFLLIAAAIIWLSVLLLEYYRDAYIKPENKTQVNKILYTEEIGCPFWKV